MYKVTTNKTISSQTLFWHSDLAVYVSEHQTLTMALHFYLNEPG